MEADVITWGDGLRAMTEKELVELGGSCRKD